MSTGLVYDPRFCEHDTGPTHPERPERLAAITKRLQAEGVWDRLVHIRATPADPKWVRMVHHPAYLARLQAACEAGEPYIDAVDSAIGPSSCDIAYLAVGGVLNAVDAVMAGQYEGQPVRNAFCAVRPPGHHCEADRSMGFCLINNVAVAAQYLIARHALERVAIVDFDVHHGNGTQHIFEERRDVLFISIHEHPSYLYPGTGFAWEKGKGAGEGTTLNIPLDPGRGDDDFAAAITGQVLPALREFEPQFLLVSAGFDASEHDPLAHLKVTAEGFSWITRQLKQAADQLCRGRLVSVLEGGYDLPSLAQCVSIHLEVLMKPEDYDDVMAMKLGL